jgi:NAD(P)-dependent dehydrogenase (short-subunit alcohol dehydrogenase family)
MSGPLSGRTAVITGAAMGIGAAYAQRLAAEGARVALVDRADCTAVADLIVAAGGDAAPFLCDLTVPQEIETAIAAVLDWRSGPLILLNNAGAYPVTPLETLTLTEWRAVFALNVEASLLMALGLIPAMKADGWGRIINIGSSILTLPRQGVLAYTASKMAVIGMTRALASDLGGHGITVNAISPGLTRTPGTERQLDAAGRTGLFDQFARNQPIGRVIEAEDMTGLAAFLAGDGSAMMTGQTLLVDGGLSRL